MSWDRLIDGAQWFFLLYFAGLNLGYLALNAFSLLALPQALESRLLALLPRAQSGYERPARRWRRRPA